jgi:plasmid maintenance system antidote protein VapI
MSDYQSQEFLFQRIKEVLPPHASLVDTVADILHLSSDSAYRRIRGETALVLDEARELCHYFKFSLDLILNVQSDATMFQNVRINTKNYSYAKYLVDITKQLEYAASFIHKEVIYLTKDMALFHNFYFRPLIAFRYFFWMKSIVQHPDFINRGFEFSILTDEIEKLSRQSLIAYNKIPSVEIWNTECINSIISQVEFYKDSGLFSTAGDIKQVYESLEESIIHLKTEVEYGVKYMPGENPEAKKTNFRFFYNRIVLGDNTIMVVTDRIKTVFINYDVLNYMFTRDEGFTNPCYEDMQNMMKRSTLISQTSEKQRNIFFNIMLYKITDRLKHL